MSIVPQNLDLSFLVGQQLTSVWVMTNHVNLYFAKYPLVSDDKHYTDSTTIGLEVGYELRVQGKTTAYPMWPDVDAFRDRVGQLIKLIGLVVTRASQLPDGRLYISFSNGVDFWIMKSPQGAESYHISSKATGAITV
jgi:hypothetical protein